MLHVYTIHSHYTWILYVYIHTYNTCMHNIMYIPPMYYSISMHTVWQYYTMRIQFHMPYSNHPCFFYSLAYHLQV